MDICLPPVVWAEDAGPQEKLCGLMLATGKLILNCRTLSWFPIHNQVHLIRSSIESINCDTYEARRGPGSTALRKTLNSSVEVIGGAIGIDVGEQVRWYDGVFSGTGSSEAVRGRYWW